MVAAIPRKPSGCFIYCQFYIILSARSENPKNVRSFLLAPDLENMITSEFFKMAPIPDQTHEQQG